MLRRPRTEGDPTCLDRVLTTYLDAMLVEFAVGGPLNVRVSVEDELHHYNINFIHNVHYLFELIILNHI